MALIELNVLATSQVFNIEDKEIIQVLPYNGTSDGTLVYSELGRVKQINIEEAPSAVASASAAIFPVVCFASGTSGNVVTRYINALRCKEVIEFSTHSGISYDESGVELVTINAALAADGGVSYANLIALIETTSSDFVTIAGAQTVTGAKTFSAAAIFSSTVATGALTVTGAASTTTTAAVGTALSIGTDIAFAKELDHQIAVTNSTTAATAGGSLPIIGGQGATSGAGGYVSLTAGRGGATGDGGAINATSGAGGSTSGASGAVNVKSGAATIGNSGVVTLASGNTASGAAGDVVLSTGTHTSTTVCPVVSLGKAVVYRPTSTAVATGATASIIGTISGALGVTGGTGAVTLPTGTEISTAIGSVTAGTHFDLIVNAIGMTGGGDVATITVAAGVVVAKQISVGDSATDQLMTVTNTAALNIGVFRFVNIAANSWSLHRIA